MSDRKTNNRVLSENEQRVLRAVASKIASEQMGHNFKFKPFEQLKDRSNGERPIWQGETPEEYGDMGVFRSFMRSYHIDCSAWIYDGDDGETLAMMDFHISYQHHGGGSNGYETQFRAEVTMRKSLSDPTEELRNLWWGAVMIKVVYREQSDSSSHILDNVEDF